jgi:hypothetical protein
MSSSAASRIMRDGHEVLNISWIKVIIKEEFNRRNSVTKV